MTEGPPRARPASQRLFVALWPDDAVRHALVRCQRELGLSDEAGVTAAAKLHLTLHFIGQVPSARVPGVADAIGQTPFGPPFDLLLDRVQRWPRGLVVLLPSQPPALLADLHQRLGRALQALDLPVEARAFRPHLTMARGAGRLPAVEPKAALRWPVQQHVLVASRPDGRYQLLSTPPRAGLRPARPPRGIKVTGKAASSREPKRLIEPGPPGRAVNP